MTLRHSHQGQAFVFQECQRFCYFFYFRDRCGCIHPRYLSSTSYLTPWLDKPTCHISTVTEEDSGANATTTAEYKCVLDTYEALDNATLLCPHCRVPC